MKLVIANRDVMVLLKKTISEILDDNVLGLAAQTAYNFFFGLFPAFLFAAPLLSLIGRKQQVYDQMMSWFASALSPDALALVRGILHDVIFGKNAPGLMSIGAVLSLYAGSAMFSSLMSALNAAYDVHESRPWWEQQLIAMGATLASVLVLGSATTLFLGGNAITSFVAETLHLGTAGVVFTALVQYLLALGLFVGAIWTIYLVLPNVHAQDKQQVLAGSIVAAVLWILVSVLFRLYVVNFGSYNKTYGTIGAVIVLLTWMYWSMFAILAGGELISELRAGTGTRAHPTGASEAPGRVPTRQGVPHPSAEVA